MDKQHTLNIFLRFDCFVLMFESVAGMDRFCTMGFECTFHPAEGLTVFLRTILFSCLPFCNLVVYQSDDESLELMMQPFFLFFLISRHVILLLTAIYPRVKTFLQLDERTAALVMSLGRCRYPRVGV